MFWFYCCAGSVDFCLISSACGRNTGGVALAGVAAPFEGCRITSSLPSCVASPSSSGTAFKELFTRGDGLTGGFVR